MTAIKKASRRRKIAPGKAKVHTVKESIMWEKSDRGLEALHFGRFFTIWRKKR